MALTNLFATPVCVPVQLVLMYLWPFHLDICPGNKSISCFLPKGVPSPAPPTPLLPASPATSVGSPAHSTVTPEENEAYLRTHHELQNYVPLLTRMMNHMLKKDGEDAQKSEKYMKLKSLHSLLQDDKKRYVHVYN